PAFTYLVPGRFVGFGLVNALPLPNAMQSMSLVPDDEQPTYQAGCFDRPVAGAGASGLLPCHCPQDAQMVAFRSPIITPASTSCRDPFIAVNRIAALTAVTRFRAAPDTPGPLCRCRPSPYLNNIIEQDHRFDEPWITLNASLSI